MAYKKDGSKSNDWVALMAGPSHFGPELIQDNFVEGEVIIADPIRACGPVLRNAEKARAKIVIAERGDCTFVSKARVVQSAGVLALIVCDNTPGSSGEFQPMFAMSGDGVNDVHIPVVFMFSQEFNKLSAAMHSKPEIQVRIMQMIEFKRWQMTKESKAKNETITLKATESTEETTTPTSTTMHTTKKTKPDKEL